MGDCLSFDQCAALFQEISFELNEQQYESLSVYADMMLNELNRQNVTAVRSVSDVWIRHFLDSAILLSYIPDHSLVVDIGTGGGLPAIPLQILNPSLSVTMLDSELRKIEFCQSVVERLHLPSRCICGRAEEIAHEVQYRSQFDFAVSRAMAAGSMLTELSIPFVRCGGTLIAMKGRNYDPVAERFLSAANQLGCTCREIPYELQNESKTLVLIQKNVDTPDVYPRRFAKIKRTPL